MYFHDDYVLFFLLTRNAYNIKKIDRIFYVVLLGWNLTDQKVEFRMKEKNRNRKFMRCKSYFIFNEFILNNTKNTIYDKKIAFFCLNRYLLSHWCGKYQPTLKKAINVANLYLKNKYIIEEDKGKIKSFLNELNKPL